jgi:hypothetical protein
MTSTVPVPPAPPGKYGVGVRPDASCSGLPSLCPGVCGPDPICCDGIASCRDAPAVIHMAKEGDFEKSGMFRT